MSFITSLFGGGSSAPRQPISPRQTPPTPRIGDSAGEASVRARRDRRTAGLSDEDTILTGLGNVGSQSGMVQRSTLLGSAARSA